MLVSLGLRWKLRWVVEEVGGVLGRVILDCVRFLVGLGFFGFVFRFVRMGLLLDGGSIGSIFRMGFFLGFLNLGLVSFLRRLGLFRDFFLGVLFVILSFIIYFRVLGF